MDIDSYMRAVIALVFVLGMLGVISLLLKKFVFEKNFAGSNSKKKRLSLEEVRPIDTRRRLVLIKRDNVEHLVLLGNNSDLLIESNITEDKGK